MRHKAVVFDLDGTLLDSLQDLADCMNFALAAQKFPTHPVASYRFFVGDGMENLARRALPEEFASEKHVAESVRLMREAYATRWKNTSRPYDGIADLLGELQRYGVKLAVLSNKPDDFTRQIVGDMFGSWEWNSVLGSRPGVPRKPDPAGALETARGLGLRPEQCLYVGDTNTDMWTANAAGMFALGATWGFRPAEELLSSGARALAEHPADVLRHL